MDREFADALAEAYEQEATGWGILTAASSGKQRDGYGAVAKGCRAKAAAWRALADRLPIPIGSTFRAGG